MKFLAVVVVCSLAALAVAQDPNFGCPTAGLAALADLPAGAFGDVPAGTFRSVAGPLNAAYPTAGYVTTCTKLPPVGTWIKAAGAGGVVGSTAYLVAFKADTKVYRAWGGTSDCCSSEANRIGGWWGLKSPNAYTGKASSKSSYRDAMGVCHAWNAFAKIEACTVKANTVVGIGKTQSADAICKTENAKAGAKCPPATFPDAFTANGFHQLYFNTYKRIDTEINAIFTVALPSTPCNTPPQTTTPRRVARRLRGTSCPRRLTRSRSSCSRATCAGAWRTSSRRWQSSRSKWPRRATIEAAHLQSAHDVRYQT